LFRGRTAKTIGLIVGVCLFALAFIASIVLGQTPTPLKMAYDAFFNFDENSTEHMILTTSRLSRAVIATVIGASLAVAGALMQALTRNPLASPSVFGINAGAVFFIVLSLSFFSLSSLTEYMWMAFIGSGVSA